MGIDRKMRHGPREACRGSQSTDPGKRLGLGLSLLRHTRPPQWPCTHGVDGLGVLNAKNAPGLFWDGVLYQPQASDRLARVSPPAVVNQKDQDFGRPIAGTDPVGHSCPITTTRRWNTSSLA